MFQNQQKLQFFYFFAGVKDEMTYNSMANHINSSSAKPKSEVDPNFVTETPWYKADFASSTAKTIDIKHNVEVIILNDFYLKQSEIFKGSITIALYLAY